MVAAAALGSEFRFRIPRHIHFPAELPFDALQGGKKVGHAHSPDNQQVDVALGPFLAPRNRTIDGGPLDTISKSH